MMPSTAAILESDHREIETLLNSVFEALSAKDRDGVLAAADLFWARLAVHIRAEHLRIFPALRTFRPDAPDIEAVLTKLRRDHDTFMTEIARAIKALRLTQHFGNVEETLAIVTGIFERIKTALVRHDEIEEWTVYPIADSLAPKVRLRLIREVVAELKKMPPRFQR